MSENTDIKPLDEKLVKEAFATLTNPSTRSVLPVGVNVSQGTFIGTKLLPTVIASPDGTETASYPTFSTDRFYSGDNDIVGIGGARNKAGMSISWTSVSLEAHGMDAPVDVRVEKQLAACGIDAAAQFLGVARGQVEVRKEKAIAALLTLQGTYASSTYYDTLSSGTQWSHADSDPLDAIADAAEILRGANGSLPNTFWCGAAVWQGFRNHAKVLNRVLYGGSNGNPAYFTLEAFAALIGMNVFIGDAVETSTLGGSTSDIWGKHAGLLYVGPNDLMTPKFGCTLTTAGSPKVLPPYFDRNIGVEGSNVYTYVDYYKPVCMSNTAGFLWEDAVA